MCLFLTWRTLMILNHINAVPGANKVQNPSDNLCNWGALKTKKNSKSQKWTFGLCQGGRNGRWTKFNSLRSKNVTLMVLMVSNVSDTTTDLLRSFLCFTVEWGHHDLRCFFLHRKNEASGGAGTPNGPWLCSDVTDKPLMTEDTRLCGKHWVFQQHKATAHKYAWEMTFRRK